MSEHKCPGPEASVDEVMAHFFPAPAKDWRDSEYIVYRITDKENDVWEPVHPGHMDRANALKLDDALFSEGIPHKVCTVKEWDIHEQGQLDSLTCPECGQFKEDCDCNF